MSKSNAGRIGVWGASGSGKSSYVKKKLVTLRRVVVFDPLDEYSKLKMKRCTTAQQVLEAMRSNWKYYRIAYVPPAGKETRALSQLSKLLLQAQEVYKTTGKGQGMTLVVEEMNTCFSVNCSMKEAAGFAEICSRGRHFGIEVYGLSQRIAEVNTRFRGNCTESVVLRQQGKNDVEAATYVLGCDKPTVTALKNLEYLHSQNGKITAGTIKWTPLKTYLLGVFCDSIFSGGYFDARSRIV